MQSRFPYFETRTMNDILFVEDIGNCCIRMGDDSDRMERYLCISTAPDGVVSILMFGKVSPGSKELMIGKSCSSVFYQMMFDQRRVEKVIKDFLKYATWAEETTYDYVKENVYDVNTKFFGE